MSVGVREKLRLSELGSVAVSTLWQRHTLGPNGIKLNVAPIRGEFGCLGVVRSRIKVIQFYLPSGIELYFK